MAGANISGDLKNPSRDIPLGTLSAVGVSTIVYACLAIFLGAVVTPNELQTNYLVMKNVSVWGPLILIGIYAATLSSALTSLVGGPRILLSLSCDNLIPALQFFSVTNSNGEPVRAYIFAYFIAVACVLIGDLNVVAPLITMVFHAFFFCACVAFCVLLF